MGRSVSRRSSAACCIIGEPSLVAVFCASPDFRLFSPLESDDSRHDEALSSRIAALNMLDLSLDHLGLITRPEDAPPEEDGLVARGLADIVDRIGDGRSEPRCYVRWLTKQSYRSCLRQAVSRLEKRAMCLSRRTSSLLVSWSSSPTSTCLRR